jgi:hypothetical protein
MCYIETYFNILLNLLFRINSEIKNLIDSWWDAYYVVDWIDLAQDGDQWMGLMNKVMNLWVP